LKGIEGSLPGDVKFLTSKVRWKVDKPNHLNVDSRLDWREWE
jgi:hypothetical protein